VNMTMTQFVHLPKKTMFRYCRRTQTNEILSPFQKTIPLCSHLIKSRQLLYSSCWTTWMLWITPSKPSLNEDVLPRMTIIHFIQREDCRAPKMWIFCFSPWTMQSSSFRQFNPFLPKTKLPVMSLHLILSRSCLDYYRIAGLWHRKIWCLTCKIHYVMILACTVR
jgi:hypothetical protein